MAYGISYPQLTFDSPFFAPAPGFYVGQITSNLSGTNLRLLTYHSGFYSYAPAYYLGATVVASSAAFTATQTADTTRNTSATTMFQ